MKLWWDYTLEGKNCKEIGFGCTGGTRSTPVATP
jgi:hypothetical protein